MAFESIEERKWKIVFKWTPTQQQSFERIKNKICTAPVLVLLDLHQPFEIEIDASDYALGAVITQSRFILRLSETQLEGTRHMKNKCMPL